MKIQSLPYHNASRIHYGSKAGTVTYPAPKYVLCRSTQITEDKGMTTALAYEIQNP